MGQPSGVHSNCYRPSCGDRKHLEVCQTTKLRSERLKSQKIVTAVLQHFQVPLFSSEKWWRGFPYPIRVNVGIGRAALVLHGASPWAEDAERFNQGLE